MRLTHLDIHIAIPHNQGERLHHMLHHRHPPPHLLLWQCKERCEVGIDPVIFIGQEVVSRSEFPPDVETFGWAPTVSPGVISNSFGEGERLPREELFPSCLAEGQQEGDWMRRVRSRGDDKVSGRRICMMVMAA